VIRRSYKPVRAYRRAKGITFRPTSLRLPSVIAGNQNEPPPGIEGEAIVKSV
jgi:hypothetical protein